MKDNKNLQDLKFNNVIVFDIDGLLCWQNGVEFLDPDDLMKVHPECNVVLYPVIEGEDYVHCFIPYLDVLLDYLINTNNRIVFFSAGPEERNIVVIQKLLTNLFGTTKYQDLKSQGQFEVFSSHHLRDSIPDKGEMYTSRIKDLRVVLKDNESIDNSILIEDVPYYAAHDQTPCIVGIKLEDLAYYPKEQHFSKNATYYLLGLFKLYFDEYKNPQHQPIRVWIKDFLLKSIANYYYKHEYGVDHLSQIAMYYLPNGTESWVMHLIINGFDEVKQRYPSAVLYGMNQFTINHDLIIENNVEPINLDFDETNFEFINQNDIGLGFLDIDIDTSNQSNINLDPSSTSQSDTNLYNFKSIFGLANISNKNKEDNLLPLEDTPDNCENVVNNKIKFNYSPS